MTCKPVVKVNLKSCIFLLSAILSIPITPLASAQLVSSGLSLVRPIVTPLVFSSSLFLPPVTYNTGGFDPSAIAVADVNGDGVPDVVVANTRRNLTDQVFGASNVGVMLGNGDGTFQSTVTYLSGGSQLHSVAIADVNNDGKLDILAGNGCSIISGGSCSFEGAVGVLLGNGDGTFRPAVNFGSGGYANFQLKVIVADVNGDSKPDLLTLNGCTTSCSPNGPPHGSVGVLLGNWDGTFQKAVTYTTTGYFATSIAVGDLNGDHNLDIVLTNYCGDNNIGGCATPGPVDVLLGNGDGTFQGAIPFGPGGRGTSGVAVADVNGDDKPDLLVTNCGTDGCGGFWPPRPGGVVGVLLGHGDGTFSPAITYGSGSYFAIDVADVDGDQNPDLVLANWACSNSGLGCISVMPGNGDGTFQSAMNFSTESDANSLAVADLNRDDKLDIVIPNRESFGSNDPPGTVSVLLNSTPSCNTPPQVTVSITPRSLWPPTGKIVPVTVSGTITDTGCSVASATYSVTDEYGRVQPSGPVTLDSAGAYSFTIFLQASRRGRDSDGRSYYITIVANNTAGMTGSQAGIVKVPHDHRHFR